MDDSPSLENTDKEEEEDSDLDSLYDAIKEHDDIRLDIEIEKLSNVDN